MLFLFLVVCLGVTGGFVWAKVSQNTFSLASLKTPEIIILEQKDSPILISSPHANSNTLKPSYGYVISNVSDKTIRAFAVKEDVFYGKENYKQSGVTLSHFITQQQLLNSNESRQQYAENNTTYPEDVNKIVLSIDFVEFEDGSVWGENSNKSDEYLEGQRAGADAAVKAFREKLNKDGLEALMEELDRDSTNIALQAEESKSSRWKTGFQSGVGVIRNRLKKASNDLGADGIITELQSSLHKTDGRQEK